MGRYLRCVGVHEAPATAVRMLELTTGHTQLGAGPQAKRSEVHANEISVRLRKLVCSAV